MGETLGKKPEISSTLSPSPFLFVLTIFGFCLGDNRATLFLCYRNVFSMNPSKLSATTNHYNVFS